MYKEVVRRLLKQAVPTDSYLGTESNDSHERREIHGFWIDTGKYRAWRTSKSGQNANGGWQNGHNQGECGLLMKIKVSHPKKARLTGGFFLARNFSVTNCAW